MIISNIRKEEAFFEALEREYRSISMNQREEFLNRAVQAFQKKADKIRDRTSEIEHGQDIQGRYGIDNRLSQYRDRGGPR